MKSAPAEKTLPAKDPAAAIARADSLRRAG